MEKKKKKKKEEGRVQKEAVPRKQKSEGETLKWIVIFQLARVIFGPSILSKGNAC